MNNQVLNSFHEEVRKEAAIRPLVRARGLVKRIFAKRSGEKTLIKTLDSDTATLLKQNPNLSRKEVKGFRTQRKTQLQNMAKETAEETQQNILTSGKPAGAKGFIAKHKGKILLGGAGAGALYLASKSNETDEAKRQQMAMQRNLGVPQKVYYN